ncbi:MAG: hypothetical protein AMXMBFR84_14400 [Candidatus Hydrogenedentota bacterium]
MSAILSWNTLWWLMLVIYVPACVFLIIIVMMQKGKGGGFAGAFGVGPGSEAVFGPRMMRSLPIRLTFILASVFMFLALTMSVVQGRAIRGAAPDKVTDSAVLSGTGTVPADDPLSGLTGLGGGAPAEAPDGAPAEAPAETSAPADASTSTAPATDAAAPAAPETPAAESVPQPAEGAN